MRRQLVIERVIQSHNPFNTLTRPKQDHEGKTNGLIQVVQKQVKNQKHKYHRQG